MRRVDGGFFASFTAGRIGRGAKFPPQFGQTLLSLFSTQSRQNVHSNVQIIASVADGGRSLSQHSQLGRNSSMSSPRIPYVVLSMDHPDHSAWQRRHHFFGCSWSPLLWRTALTMRQAACRWQRGANEAEMKRGDPKAPFDCR